MRGDILRMFIIGRTSTINVIQSPKNKYVFSLQKRDEEGEIMTWNDLIPENCSESQARILTQEEESGLGPALTEDHAN